MGYALVKIKNGASIGQDMCFGKWVGNDSPVFSAEKKIRGNGEVRWDCRAYGYGIMGGDSGAYGNGGIYVFGSDSIEMLTPLLGYRPDIPPDTQQESE